MPATYYNINMFTNLTNYNPQNTTTFSNYFIVTKPVLANASVSPLKDGWGATRTFIVKLTDEDLDLVDPAIGLKVWFKCIQQEIPGGCAPSEYTTTNSRTNTTVSGVGVNVTFTVSFLSTDRGNWTFKFNVSDNRGNTFDTGDVGNFTITKDNITFVHIIGNNTSVQRSAGSQLLSVRATDVQTGSFIPDDEPGKTFVTNDTASNFILVGSPLTVEGYIN